MLLSPEDSPKIIDNSNSVSKEKHDENSPYPSESDAFSVTENNDSPVPKIQLVWEDIKFQVKVKNNDQMILKGASGSANPGEFLAIMGLSGAGKTSLLNIIAGRIKSSDNSRVTGSIKANGIDINSMNFQKYSAYITQEDVLLPFLTVKETLMFSAKLKCSGTSSEIMNKVDKIIGELRLGKVTHNRIGNAVVKGISGGERKRVCIATELISEPQIIILDEPTSGLDSFTAEVLVDLLLEQAKKGKTVVSTIHQPSASIFFKFQKLILVSEGYTIYQGSAKASRKYFSRIGFKSPANINPPDYYMRILHITDRHHMTDEELETLEHLREAYNNVKDHKDQVLEYDSTHLDLVHIQEAQPLKKIGTLCKRSFIDGMRNPGKSHMIIMFYIVTSALIDLIFHDLGDDYDAIQNINGVLTFCSINSVMIANSSSSLTFPGEKAVFLKEYSQGLYGAFSYFIAKMFTELPVQIFATLIASVMLYFPLGLQMEADKFFLFWLIVFLTFLTGSGLGYMIGALCDSENMASALSPMLTAPLMAFGGLYSNASAFKWVRYISPFKWSFEAMAVNQYDGMDFDCDPDGPECDPLDDLGFYDKLGICILAQIVYIIVTRIIAYTELKALGAKSKK
mmetsp:Transcript_3179/g.2915  ORF Transcript_3179/g.2915 Transcript_3179/m.2915 type:complete len:625 (+) Transcript_3179:16-1890(+)